MPVLKRFVEGAWVPVAASGGSIDVETMQDVVGAMIEGAGGTYDDTAGTIALPAVGAATAVQVGALTLPTSPAIGESVTVLADASTVLPAGITWDSGGAPTATDRLLVSLVWSGEDWVGTYGPPIPIYIDPSWAPTSLAGVDLWLDASDTASITHVAAAVAQWSDKSGAGHDFVQADGLKQPTLGTTTAALPAVVFDAASTLDLATKFSPWKGMPGFTAAVMRFAACPEYTYPVSWAKQRIGRGAGFFRGAVSGTIESQVAFDAAIHTFSLVADTSASAFRVDDTVATGAFGEVVGEDATLGAAGFVGEICEIIHCSTIPGPADIAKIHAYLQAKWGTP